MGKEILTVGSIALDSIETPYGRVKDVGGGSAVHFSLSASVFAKTKIVGVVGEDYPQEMLDFLSDKGIDISGIEIRKGEKTFRWNGYYEKDMAVAYSKKTELNVFKSFSPQLNEEFSKTPFVFLANIDPELQLQVIDKMVNPEFICADTMNFWIERKPDKLWRVINKIDFLILNDQEIRQLTGKYNLLKAAKKVVDSDLRFGLVVKKGENGSTLFFKDGSYFSIPGYLLEKVVDPTGAGDSFAGGFIGYLASVGNLIPQEFKKAILYGNALGSLNVEGFGYSKVATLGRKDVEKRITEIEKIFRF
jgi:sugar/nucleoside kinase (ribokinase family)